MITKLYKKETRGTADFGWLKANFSFSFGNYFNPDRLQFGVLRVLNDDCIAAGMGFGTHPHKNMEIITIPLEGSLIHKDSMQNQGIIEFGEIQVMSAGTGIQHSEYNASNSDLLKLLQIWIFPENEEVEPRYDQKKFDLDSKKNSFVTIVSPQNKCEENSLWVHQQCYFDLGVFDDEKVINYSLRNSENGIFLFIIDGEIIIDNQKMSSKDAMEITNCNQIEIITNLKSKILLIEVPMKN